MATKERLTQPLKWHGGKHYLAKRIIDLMPPHVHYVEPYFGGGSVMLNKPYDGISEVVNDCHFELTNFWRTLQDVEKFERFTRIIQAVPFSEVEWADSSRPTEDPVQMAVQFFIRCRQSRAGKLNVFATLSRNRTRRQMNEQAAAWLTAVDGLAAVSQRLKRVVILNEEAVKVIHRQDGANTLFYLDPPYLHETRVTTADYDHEMTVDQHRTMLQAITQVTGKVILSGYPNAIYEEYLQDWFKHDIVIDNKASSRKEKPKMTERLWMNFKPDVGELGTDESSQ